MYAYKSDALSVAYLFDLVKKYDREFKPSSFNFYKAGADMSECLLTSVSLQGMMDDAGDHMVKEMCGGFEL